jgi:signal transduction histidine kinase
LDDFADASGPVGVMAREAGYRSAVGTPIIVDGRFWGVMTAASTAAEPLPADTELRLASFTALVATAIANTESRAESGRLLEELTASRARVVAAADETRRRIERDLHDGIQQRLVSLALQARAMTKTTPEPSSEIRGELTALAEELTDALDELREFSRGIHPAILSEAGLGPALRTLARRSVVPVALHMNLDSRLEEPIEVAAYYIASEALTNTVKHAQATGIELQVDYCNNALTLAIRDDGIGGADPSGGSGLIGVKDRVEALGGTLSVTSPPGQGTLLRVKLPAEARAASTPPQTQRPAAAQ